MRKIHWLAATAVAAAAPASGQMMSGGAHEMSAIPGTALPDASGSNIDQAIRSIDSQSADARAQRIAYQQNLRIRREQAEQYAAAARNGVPLPPDAADTLRRELAADIEQWRVEFNVRHKESQAMRDQWLVARDSLTAVQWAQRRVDWWAAICHWPLFSM